MKTEYPCVLSPLDESDGGGWLVTYPDLPGCMSDGDTPEEAIRNGDDAVQSWLAVNIELDRPVPKSSADVSGKFLVRVPKSIHSRLITKAELEGVSMNAYVNSVLSKEVA